MQRKLVTIQPISEVSPIPGADNIEAVRVMGWTVVVKKGEFIAGDPCVFFEIDSVLPDGPAWSEFMRPHRFRVKTVRLRGVLSQGLALPTSIFESCPGLWGAGERFAAVFGSNQRGDLAAALGVTKHEPPLPAGLDCTGPFPTLVPKTDEIRLQSCLGVLDELGGADLVVTTKLDGQSATYLRGDDGELIVCARNWALRRSAAPHWKLADQLQLARVLPVGFALQGEVCGPGIQKNRLGLTEHKLFAFDVYDVRAGRYLDKRDFSDFCGIHGVSDIGGIPTVPVEHVVSSATPGRCDLATWLGMARGKYMESGNRKEGIVVRPMREMRSATLGGRLSFKVINNEYLLKDEE